MPRRLPRAWCGAIGSSRRPSGTFILAGRSCVASRGSRRAATRSSNVSCASRSSRSTRAWLIASKWRAREAAMHEMALAESVIEIVERAARQHAAAAVRAVRLEIGRLSHVEPDALRFAFDVVKRNGVAHGARLEILATEGTAWCMQC